MQADALKRFTKTPFKATFALDGIVGVVSTNDPALADRLQDALGVPALPVKTAFNWRVVVEPEDDLQAEPASTRRLIHNGLALIALGQHCFLACDLETREGIGFIPLSVLHDEDLFHRKLLPALTALMKEGQ